MALGTYSDLLASVATWLARDNMTAIIPDCITLFEAWVNRRLRIRQQDTTATLTTSSGSVALPTDYLSWRRLTWSNSSQANELLYVTPDALRLLFPISNAGIPSNFSIEGANLLTRDTDDTASAFSFEYFQKTAALVGTLNWLYVAHPDAYLFGTLTECYGAQKDASNMALWGSRRNDVFDEIERLDMKTRGPSAIVVAGPTP